MCLYTVILRQSLGQTEKCMAENQPAAAVYVSWTTFKNAVEMLSHGVPNQIDRTTFVGLSGGVQNQLFAALKFLGLMRDDGAPTDTLHALAVPDETKRKEELRKLIKERYAELFALDLAKATHQQLNDRMASAYNVSGDTKDKAVRFFLSALGYLEIQVSRFIQIPGANNGSAPRVKRRAAPKQRVAANAAETPPNPGKPAGTSREITLRSGGVLTLSASLDLFSLTPDDRTFVFDLIDRLEKYEKQQ